MTSQMDECQFGCTGYKGKHAFAKEGSVQVYAIQTANETVRIMDTVFRFFSLPYLYAMCYAHFVQLGVCTNHLWTEPCSHVGVSGICLRASVDDSFEVILENITMNKASGGDGIPVELFQILKDDAVKVLHLIFQQIWITQQWPQDWKR